MALTVFLLSRRSRSSLERRGPTFSADDVDSKGGTLDDRFVVESRMERTLDKTIPVTYAPFLGTDGRLYTRPERVLEPVNMEMRALRRPPQTTIVRNPETIGMRVMALLEHGYDYGSHRHRMRCPYAVMNHNPRTGEVEEVFVSRGFTPAKERRFAIKRRRERLAAALRALTHLD